MSNGVSTRRPIFQQSNLYDATLVSISHGFKSLYRRNSKQQTGGRPKENSDQDQIRINDENGEKSENGRILAVPKSVTSIVFVK